MSLRYDKCNKFGLKLQTAKDTDVNALQRKTVEDFKTQWNKME